MERLTNTVPSLTKMRGRQGAIGYDIGIGSDQRGALLTSQVGRSRCVGTVTIGKVGL